MRQDEIQFRICSLCGASEPRGNPDAYFINGKFACDKCALFPAVTALPEYTETNQTMTIVDNHQRPDGTHHYANTTKYQKTELFCPFCGLRSIWLEDGDGYYIGMIHQCDNLECSHSFALSSHNPEVSELELARARQLSSGIADQPHVAKGHPANEPIP